MSALPQIPESIAALRTSDEPLVVVDVGGNIVSGPPPRPLERLTVNVSGEDLVVSRG